MYVFFACIKLTLYLRYCYLYIVIGFNYLEAVIGVNGTLGTLLVGYLVSLREGQNYDLCLYTRILP